jgi:hypothetical protein
MRRLRASLPGALVTQARIGSVLLEVNETSKPAIAPAQRPGSLRFA